MKCAVLGGGGFLGSHLSETLLACDHEVRVFDRPEAQYLEYSRERGASIVTGDFHEPADIRGAIEGCDVVYHLVSATVPKTSSDDMRYDVEANVIGTLQLLDVMREAQVPKIVFASSGGTVYGIPQEIPIKESHPTDPACSYGICKLTIEKYLHLYWTLYGLDYRIIRAANAYGERQPVGETQGVIAAFLDRTLRKEAVAVWGDGSVVRDYVHASDIAKAFARASLHEGEPRIYNVGSGQGRSLNEIIRIIENATGQPLNPKYMPGRRFDVPVNVLDISRARLHLDWHPMVGLEEGIARTYEWMIEERKNERL